MRNICFIGIFDKLDLLIYLGKILNGLKHNILIIDVTQNQRAKYVVPTIKPTKAYITHFENVDIAVGFENYEEIEKYIGITEGTKPKYDYALVNIDKPLSFSQFNNMNTIKNYFVTSFDLYSIRRGLQTIKGIEKPIKMTKLLFSREISIEDDYYLNYMSLGYKIIWDENKINFPYNTEDIEVMIENQKNNKIRIKGLSQQYKDCLSILVMDMFTNVDITEITKIMKNIEKE